ncbi:MAG: hypothetical protein HY905_14305 [Deltaproteobacteria bacterium]|nr:hypothetical protein [Deltaproteobacteria bacterium]
MLRGIPAGLFLFGTLAGCGLPIADIRSAAESGDLERAIRLAQGELEGLQAAGRGTIVRLQSNQATRLAALEALDLAPATASELLAQWAAEDSAVDEATRTFAQARLAELEGGAFEEELQAARESDEPLVRSYALRGLIADGLPADRMLAALEDDAPQVRAVAAKGLVRAAEESGMPDAVRQALRPLVDGPLDVEIRAQLAGLLDPAAAEDLASLVGLLADERPALRIAAARALGRLPDPRAVPEAAALLEAQVSPAGLALALAAGRHGLVELRDTYLARIFVVSPTDDPLRTGALLGVADGEDARALWHAALAGGGPAEKTAACERLLAAGQDEDACRDALRGIATGGGAPAASLSAAEILFEEGDPAAAGWLRSYAADGDPAVRRRIMNGAAARRYDADLIAIGLGDPEPAVAAAAAVAALRVPDPLARPGIAP